MTMTSTPAGPTGSGAKLVYSFGGGQAEGSGEQKELLGGKGAGLAEMTRIGLRFITRPWALLIWPGIT